MTFPEAALFLCLLALAGIVLIWAWIPPLFHWLGCYHVRNDEDRAPPVTHMEQPEYRDFAAQLQALGFTPVSGYRKTIRYFLHHWVKTFQGRVFLSPDGLCAAKIYWLNACDLPRVSFNTLLGNGTLLETCNSLPELRVDQPDSIRWGLLTCDLGQLHDEHRKVVAERTGTGSPPQPFHGLADVIAASEAVDWPSLKRTRSTAGQMLLIYVLFFFAAGTSVAALLEDHPCALPAAAIAGGLSTLLLKVVHYYAIRSSRKEELEQAKVTAPDA
jgi:hypothetical protein